MADTLEQALGYELEHIGNLEPNRLAEAAEGDPAALEEVEAILIAGTNTGARSDFQRPSMGQDMLKGRRTEIEFINGFIVEKAQSLGLKTPANAALTDIVKRVENGALQADPKHLIDLRLN